MPQHKTQALEPALPKGAPVHHKPSAIALRALGLCWTIALRTAKERKRGREKPSNIEQEKHKTGIKPHLGTIQSGTHKQGIVYKLCKERQRARRLYALKRIFFFRLPLKRHKERYCSSKQRIWGTNASQGHLEPQGSALCPRGGDPRARSGQAEFIERK